MSLLDTAISELLSIEPFWNICFPCKFHGFCCKGAKIKFEGSEKDVVDQYVLALPTSEQRIILENTTRSHHCIYRAPNKCLIHEVRPENCRYTPFQVLVDEKDVLRYTMLRIGRSGHCEFHRQKVQLNQSQSYLMKSRKFLRLVNFDQKTYYLSLNWVLDQKHHP